GPVYRGRERTGPSGEDVGLDFSPPPRVVIRWVLVIDNAGRRCGSSRSAADVRRWPAAGGGDASMNRPSGSDRTEVWAYDLPRRSYTAWRVVRPASDHGMGVP